MKLQSWFTSREGSFLLHSPSSWRGSPALSHPGCFSQHPIFPGAQRAGEQPGQAPSHPSGGHSVGNRVQQCRRAAMTNYCKLSGLRSQKCILMVLEPRNQGVPRVVPSGGPEGESTPRLSPSLRQWPSVLSVPCLVGASLQSLPLYAHHLLLCVPVSSPFLSLLRILLLDCGTA